MPRLLAASMLVCLLLGVALLGLSPENSSFITKMLGRQPEEAKPLGIIYLAVVLIGIAVTTGWRETTAKQVRVQEEKIRELEGSIYRKDEQITHLVEAANPETLHLIKQLSQCQQDLEARDWEIKRLEARVSENERFQMLKEMIEDISDDALKVEAIKQMFEAERNSPRAQTSTNGRPQPANTEASA